jgi:hypothetical protein
MGMPGSTLGLTRPVLDCTHVVEEKERVGEAEIHSRKWPADDESLTLELPMSGDDLADATPVGSGRQRGQAGKGEGVSGDSGHRRSSVGFLLDGATLTRQLFHAERAAQETIG